jgi:tellurite methyltransferase
MHPSPSVRFFEAQFARQIREGDFNLNPFERLALPYLAGRVLDYGCGIGNLAIAAARRGCSVVALDGSPEAIRHVRGVAARERLAIDAEQANLGAYELREEFDSVVSIGLLMFLDCATALARLGELQAHLRPGGIAVVNVLVEGTTYLDMFDPASHCLFAREEMRRRFAGWEVLRDQRGDFSAPNDTIKSFLTIVARKPLT